MKVTISRLIGRSGESLPFSIAEQIESLAGYPDVVGFLEPVKIEGILTNVDEIMELDCTGETKAEILCSRCLAPVQVKVNFKLNEKFSHAGILNEETETFSGDEIHLLEVVTRGIIATLPMKIVCKEDCKGLCTVCGKDLNEEDCGCDRTYIDPRFESLRALFEVDEEV